MGTARTGDGGPHTPPQPPEALFSAPGIGAATRHPSSPDTSVCWSRPGATPATEHVPRCTRVCTHTHAHTPCTHACMPHMHTCTCMRHTCTHISQTTCMHAHIHYTCVCMRHMHASHAPHMCTHVHACTTYVCTYRKLHVCVHIYTTRMYACHTCMPHACPHHARHTHSAQPPARQPRACRDMNGPAVGTRLLPAAICSAPRCTPPCLQTSALPSGHRSKWISGSEVWLAFFY